MGSLSHVALGVLLLAFSINILCGIAAAAAAYTEITSPKSAQNFYLALSAITISVLGFVGVFTGIMLLMGRL